ncbi:unnamed protein product, partial [Mesorhabditis belari]|uniref:CUB domain-containing protein n=1 Tax=Mesorhabditis belari TaxID=2138241 RepID=A0AAF3J7C0_9BILA
MASVKRPTLLREFLVTLYCKCDIGFSLRPDGRTCESTCGGFLRASSGSIQSPNFPENYPPGKNCVWEIEAGEGYQLECWMAGLLDGWTAKWLDCWMAELSIQLDC